MLKLFFWLRYLRKKKIVFLSIAAVALSCALLIVIANLFNGFIDAIEAVGRESFGDVYLDPWVCVDNYQQFLEQLEELPEVEAAAATVFTYGLLRIGPGDVRAVHVQGIDPDRYSKVTGLKKSLIFQADEPAPMTFATDNADTGGFVGIAVLDRPDEKTDKYDFQKIKTWRGKQVVLTTGTVIEQQINDGRQAHPKFKRKVLPFTITDVVFTGMYLRDSKYIYLPIEKVQQLIRTSDRQQRGPHEVFNIKLADGIESEPALEPIRKLWQDFAGRHNLPQYAISDPLLKTSGQMQEYYIAELRKQMSILMLIFGIVCSAAVVLIFCIFYMIVMTKQKDIAVIKSCGAGSWSVTCIFLGFGAFVGVVGSVFGTILGIIVTKNISVVERLISMAFGLKLWKSSVYMFEKIPNQLYFTTTAWIVFFAVLAAAVGALIPAIVAAKSDPVRILRYE